MNSSVAVSHVEAVQAALSVLSMLNITAPKFPPDITPSNGTCYDYIVAGGGVSGSVVTARLVEAGHSVLMLEAGGLPGIEAQYPGMVTYMAGTYMDWHYTAETEGLNDSCKKTNKILVPKVVGGLGTLDYTVYNKGSSYDFKKWVKVTEDESWSWENMLKYFKKSEALKDEAILNSEYGKYYGTDGKINITRDPNDVCDKYIKGFELAGEPTPVDNIGNTSWGFSRGLFNIYNGKRNDALFNYIHPLKDNPKINLSINSLVTKILFNKCNKASGVEFVKAGKKITVNARKEVILAAGPIKSPQVLMLSGIGPKLHLKKFDIPCVSNLPVGQNLQNLIGAFLVFKTEKKANPEPYNPDNFPTALVVGYSAKDKSKEQPDYETLNFITEDYDYFLELCGFTLGLQNELCDRLHTLSNNTQLLVTVLNNLKIKSSGTVKLNSSNPDDAPIVKQVYYSLGELQDTAEEIEHFMGLISTPYFKDMGLNFIDPTDSCNGLIKGTKSYWRCYAKCMVASTVRYVGTNSLGSVVDTNLLVKGVKGLRVVDRSIMPSIISGPIFGATVALAEKAAELIMTTA